MSFDLFDKQAFLNAITPAEKPVAFLVGSPLSWHACSGVSGVDDMCRHIRDVIKARKERAMPGFESAIAGKKGADLYQTALRWLQGNISQAAVNTVIQSAVRGARRPTADKDFDEDGTPDDWFFPAGTMQLVELVCRHSEEFPGPILTTNFDPLLSLAIEKTGTRPYRRRVVDGDGNLERKAEDAAGSCLIAHLHGYWRASDTLHSHAQLTAARPKLKASLQSILRQRTLVVVAYSGWDDVFTVALADLLHDDEAQLDVLWCFRESDGVEVAAHYARLIEKMQPAIARGVFRAYGGVDCHSIFEEVMTELVPASVAPTDSLAPLASPIPGWKCLDEKALDAFAPLKENEARRYYDGAAPTWRHALSELVPRREAAALILDRRFELDGEDSASLQLIRAAGGEGKTTLLLQAAVDAVREYTNVRIIWRPSPKFSFSPDQLLELSEDFQWLIVADDAENLVQPISDAVQRLHGAGKTNVDFLLAARDSDWRAKGGDRQSWGLWLKIQPDVVLRGISEEDAKVVVAAWEKAGGLRKLEEEGDPVRRSALLLKAVNDQLKFEGQKRNDGSFFGGLLAVRFGEFGLRAHVREFLTQLRGISIHASERNLAEALLYVAACHGAGIEGLDENVLADLLDIPRDWIGSRVTRPLGEEAAAVSGDGRVFTRHSQVAAAVLLEAETALDVDLAEIWARIVRQTVRTGKEVSVHYETHSTVIHVGPRLQDALPPQMPEERRKAIAISAGKAAAESKTEWLGVVVDLGRTYRKAGMHKEAAGLFRRELAGANKKVDFNDNVRGYWYEWGVCEGCSVGKGEHHVNAWLQGVSISDRCNPTPISDEQIKLTCAGLGVAFGKLATNSAACLFARALRAVIDIGRKVPLDPRAEGYFNNHERSAEKLGAARPQNLDEALAWLTEGVNAAALRVTDPELIRLTRSVGISFDGLRTALMQASRTDTRVEFSRFVPPVIAPGVSPSADTSTPMTLPLQGATRQKTR